MEKNIEVKKEEWLDLIKAHKKNDIDFYSSHFRHGVTGSAESKRAIEDCKRINEIIDHGLVTPEEAGRAIDEAYREYAIGVDPEVWNIFLNGPKELRDAVQEKFMSDETGTLSH